MFLKLNRYRHPEFFWLRKPRASEIAHARLPTQQPGGKLSLSPPHPQTLIGGLRAHDEANLHSGIFADSCGRVTDSNVSASDGTRARHCRCPLPYTWTHYQPGRTERHKYPLHRRGGIYACSNQRLIYRVKTISCWRARNHLPARSCLSRRGQPPCTRAWSSTTGPGQHPAARIVSKWNRSVLTHFSSRVWAWPAGGARQNCAATPAMLFPRRYERWELRFWRLFTGV